MRTRQITAVLVSLVLICVVCHAASSEDPQVESLINKLAETSQIGYGYSAQFSGSQFLPVQDSDQVGTLVLGSEAPARSTTIEAVVKCGLTAVSSLLTHLDDGRETKIPPLKGMMWMSFADEYDFNRRVRKDAPAGVNRDTFDTDQPSSHTITVGDLCFVALGQIVNRNFNATRYQPTGGLVVNSPTYSKRLRDVARADFQGLNEEKHQQLLAQDFVTPDDENRRIGAYRRLAFYYPDEVEALVPKQLSVPTYNIFKIEKLIRGELYLEKSKDKRREIFDGFVKASGQASSDGILVFLFDDLDTEVADEQHRLAPPLKRKYDARALLVQLYGYKEDVKSTDKPYVDTWESATRARFIKALVQDRSVKIDEAVHEIFLKVKDDDYLALACIHRLIDRGYDQEIRHYCESRVGKDENYTKELQDVVAKLDSKQLKGHHQ